MSSTNTENWSDRAPDTRYTLRRIAAAGIDIGTVIDVGVLTGTAKLYEELPNAHHILIEPSPAHNDTISQNYAGISHQLIPVAASDVDADAFLVDHAIDGGETVTHSTVVHDADAVEAIPNKIKIHDMPLRRLDTLLDGIDTPGEILLKIDVDGHEMKVLGGAPETLRRASFVSIEATRAKLIERASFLQDAGFEVFDIVDICYYRDVLWQVDMIFVRKDIRERIPDLRPNPGDPNAKFDPLAYFEFGSVNLANPLASAIAERDKALQERDAAIVELARAKRYPWKYLKYAAKLRMQRGRKHD